MTVDSIAGRLAASLGEVNERLPVTQIRVAADSVALAAARLRAVGDGHDELTTAARDLARVRDRLLVASRLLDVPRQLVARYVVHALGMPAPTYSVSGVPAEPGDPSEETP